MSPSVDAVILKRDVEMSYINLFLHCFGPTHGSNGKRSNKLDTISFCARRQPHWKLLLTCNQTKRSIYELWVLETREGDGLLTSKTEVKFPAASLLRRADLFWVDRTAP